MTGALDLSQKILLICLLIESSSPQDQLQNTFEIPLVLSCLPHKEIDYLSEFLEGISLTSSYCSVSKIHLGFHMANQKALS